MKRSIIIIALCDEENILETYPKSCPPCYAVEILPAAGRLQMSASPSPVSIFGLGRPPCAQWRVFVLRAAGEYHGRQLVWGKSARDLKRPYPTISQISGFM